MGKGKITSSDLQGPLADKQISDLVNIIKSGGAYVNVHTQQNQNGEIRGQTSFYFLFSLSGPLASIIYLAYPIKIEDNSRH